MKTTVYVLSAGALLFATTGCATRQTGLTIYEPWQVNIAQRVEWGVVEGVRTVVIDGESSPLGRYGGGAIGGAAVGTTVGSGSGAVIASAGGAVAGAVAGEAVEKALTTRTGQEISVALDNGDHIVVVQERDQGQFYDGERVRVLMSSAGTARVTR
jgi:outer membrane lipoprotein SlyB